MRRLGLVVILALLLAALLTSCSTPINDSPPDYVKDVVTYIEGPYLISYFILADGVGAPTSADGTVTVLVESEGGHWSASYSIKADDFGMATLGRGAFEREDLICVLPRVRIADIGAFTTQDFSSDYKLSFRPLGVSEMLEGNDLIIW